MISKDQATRIADQIMQQARSARKKTDRPVFLFIPPWSRCRELHALPRWVQTDLIREASQETMRNPVYLVFVVLWIAMVIATWVYATSLHGRVSSIAPLIGISWIVPFLVRSVLVRRYVRMIATQLQTRAPIDAR